jgi:hypothetical protein
MNTSTLLRQAIHTLEAAHEEAQQEYGYDSVQAELVAEACIWLRDWMRHYTALRTGDE